MKGRFFYIYFSIAFITSAGQFKIHMQPYSILLHLKGKHSMLVPDCK